MTRFVLGMIAAGLWLAAIVVIVLVTRNSPDRPAKSILGFRRVRRNLAPPPRAERIVETVQPRVEPVQEQPAPFDAVGPTATDPELAEITAVLESITDPASPRKRHRVVGSDKPRTSGPRKAGRHTYVLVDHEGRPQL